MYHLKAVRESILWTDSFNSLSYNLKEYQEKSEKICKMKMLQSSKHWGLPVTWSTQWVKNTDFSETFPPFVFELLS